MLGKWEFLLVFVFVGVFTLTGLVHAGELDQTETPAPTMKTLDEIYNGVDNIPPAWTQKLPASERFVLVLDGEGVLDRETGLVWEQSPSGVTRDWFIACSHCTEKRVGGRKGWRLPTIEELMSLVSSTNVGGLFLPSGHPFTLPFNRFWSITSVRANTDDAYGVDFANDSLLADIKSATLHLAWCVRGGKGYDGQ